MSWSVCASHEQEAASYTKQQMKPSKVLLAFGSAGMIGEVVALRLREDMINDG